MEHLSFSISNTPYFPHDPHPLPEDEDMEGMEGIETGFVNVGFDAPHLPPYLPPKLPPHPPTLRLLLLLQGDGIKLPTIVPYDEAELHPPP